MLGSGTLTVAGGGAPSNVVFTTPVPLPAGTWGMAIEVKATTNGPAPGPLHHLILSPGTSPSAQDQWLSISNFSFQATAFTSGAPLGNDMNLRITYTPVAGQGYYAQYGDGCYFRPHAFYQNTPESPGTPNLANTGISMLFTGTNYVVVPAPSNVIAPAGTPLNAGAYGAASSGNWDDAITAPITLPFTFPYPTNSTSTITISSNGSVFLAAETSGSYAVCGASYGSIVPFQDGKPRIAPYYHDLDPSVAVAPNGLYYEVDPAATPQWVRITWYNIVEWGVPAAVNTMQLTLNANGDVNISYGSLGNQSAANNAITGFTPGNGSRLPASQNLIATMPFQSGDGQIPPVQGMSARPILGTTPAIQTTNITAGTLFVFQVAGFVAIPAGIPLDPLGMPGCKQYLTPVTASLLPVIGGISSFNLFIPNLPGFLNTVLVSQAAPFTAGLNPLGILTSNGLCMKVGT
jgi:hypothetical protein